MSTRLISGRQLGSNPARATILLVLLVGCTDPNPQLTEAKEFCKSVDSTLKSIDKGIVSTYNCESGAYKIK